MAVIIRISEAHVRPDKLEEFMRVLLDLVKTFPEANPGLLSHEVVVDVTDPLRVAYRSEWADEASVAAFAGESWATEPVTFPGEDELLQRPLVLRHFTAREITPG